MDFFQAGRKERMSGVVSVEGRMEMGICFWECNFPLVVHVRELSKFTLLVARDRSSWPRCLLWHGWLPGLSVAGERAPWADSLGQ